MADIINDVIRVHGADNVLHGLRLRKGIKLFRAMDTRELSD